MNSIRFLRSVFVVTNFRRLKVWLLWRKNGPGSSQSSLQVSHAYPICFRSLLGVKDVLKWIIAIFIEAPVTETMIPLMPNGSMIYCTITATLLK